MPCTRILFFGNPLHGDDGFGPAVYAELCRRNRAGGIPRQPLTEAIPRVAASLVYVETASLGALGYLEGCDEALFVDALHCDDCDDPSRLGTVEELDAQSLLEMGAIYSTHAVGLPFLVRALPVAFGAGAPRVRILGAYGERVTQFRMSLSPLMDRAVTDATLWIEARYDVGGEVDRGGAPWAAATRMESPCV